MRKRLNKSEKILRMWEDGIQMIEYNNNSGRVEYRQYAE